jgi:hypothetical protein
MREAVLEAARCAVTAIASILDAIRCPNSTRCLEQLSWLEPADFETTLTHMEA